MNEEVETMGFVKGRDQLGIGEDPNSSVTASQPIRRPVKDPAISSADEAFTSDPGGSPSSTSPPHRALICLAHV